MEVKQQRQCSHVLGGGQRDVKVWLVPQTRRASLHTPTSPSTAAARGTWSQYASTISVSQDSIVVKLSPSAVEPSEDTSPRPLTPNQWNKTSVCAEAAVTVMMKRSGAGARKWPPALAHIIVPTRDWWGDRWPGEGKLVRILTRRCSTSYDWKGIICESRVGTCDQPPVLQWATRWDGLNLARTAVSTVHMVSDLEPSISPQQHSCLCSSGEQEEIVALKC